MAVEKCKAEDQDDMGTMREDQSAIGHLAALLSNGVIVAPGQNYPAGWEDSSGGKIRRYVPAKEEHLTAARRLLGWDRPEGTALKEGG